MRKRFGFLAVCGVLLLSSGCAKDTPRQIGEDSGGYVEEELSTYAGLPESSEKRFSYDDLVVSGISMGASVEDLTKLLGNADSDESTQGGQEEEHTYIYNGADGKKTKFIFMRIDGQLTLCGVESDDTARVFTRGLKVGESKDKVRDTFYRDADSLNHNLMSDDNATVLGKFLYGTTTIDRLEEKQVKETLEYAIINYNGRDAMEDEGVILEYFSMPAPFLGETAGYNDDYAQIFFYVGADNTIQKICWYYYPEIS